MTKLIPGCNYHTTWQSHPGMRFVLVSTDGESAILKTRVSDKLFTTKASDLIFIETEHNINKAERLTKK